MPWTPFLAATRRGYTYSQTTGASSAMIFWSWT